MIVMLLIEIQNGAWLITHTSSIIYICTQLHTTSYEYAHPWNPLAVGEFKLELGSGVYMHPIAKFRLELGSGMYTPHRQA